MRKIRYYILTVMMLLLGFTRVMAEDITVTVTPVQEILPPQLLLYLNDPGKFFNVMVTNNTTTDQNVYLVMQIEHVEPASGLSISTPPKYQSPMPISLASGETKQLVSSEMKKLFNHIPANAFSSTAQDLFNNYSNGSFGLLPEGLYEMYLTAYKWSNPKTATPVVVSNPTGGNCFFRVCYKAQAPKFVAPSQFDENGIATVDARTATFMWDAPVLAMRPEIAFDYDYRLKIVEVNQEIHQDPADAIEYNAPVYDKSHLTMTTAMLPMTVISSSFKTDKLYAAQITASQTSSSKDAMRYSMVENDGKSEYLLFRIATAESKADEIQNDDASDDTKDDDGDDTGDKDDDKDDDKKKDEPKDDDDAGLFIWMGNVSHKDEIDPSAMYSFRNPKITKPVFLASSARKEFTGVDIEVEWNQVWHLGGEGLQPDTLKFAYEVELFNGGEEGDVSSVFDGSPIFSSGEIEELKYTIKWEDIAGAISPNDHIVLRVNPVVKHGESVAFSNDCNILDFAVVERLTKQYFQCSNTVEINNLEPTKKTKEQLTAKGVYVSIGEYQLKIDKIESGDAENGFKGKGRVKWEPLGLTMMLCVEFDGLKINTDDIVYEGQATTYPEENNNKAGVVAELFSDWGIDNVIKDSGIPYASAITGTATSAIQNLADKYDFATYYDSFKTASNIWDALTGNEDGQIFLPLSLPDAMTKNIPGEMKIQIGTMKFAPTHATMDLIGEFAIPDNKVTDTEVLVFGAPRLCISPNRILPESGTIALLSDLNIKIKGDNAIKFKAPTNVLEPKDGCYVAWKTDLDTDDTSLDMLGLDVDITIEKLKKVMADGTVSETAHPVLNFRTSISAWDDFLIDNAAFDSSFEVEDLPGWTFTASALTYDHSLYRNSANMKGNPFPEGYDKSYLTQDGYTDWQGLYFSEISVRMPKSFEFGTEDDRRLKLALKNLFIDDSGFTFALSADNVLSAKTGKLGGWAFSLDEIGIEVVQDDFKGCYFNGTVGVPLLKDKEGEMASIGYDCQILRHEVVYEDNSTDKQTAYVFRMKQMDEEMQLDMFLAKLNLLQKQSYFLVEAMPSEKIASKGELDTKVELVLGGSLRIAGSDWVESKIKDKLKFDINVPDIHFVGLRIANCEPWDSKLKDIAEMQKNAKIENNKFDESHLILSEEGKEFHNEAKTFYFHTGAWSLASMSKKLGPFEFTLTGYNISMEAGDSQNTNEKGSSANSSGMKVGLSLAGKVALVQGLNISAMAGVTLLTDVYNIDDISNLDVEFDRLRLDSCGVETTFCGIDIHGKLTNVEGDEDDGFSADLKVKLPGDIFNLDMTGGFYTHNKGKEDEFTWGYGAVSLKSGAAGIPIPPIQINGIKGGLYFNCSIDSVGDTKPKPKKDVIGVALGMSISATGGDGLIGGDFTCTVVYDKENDRLSQFLFQGHIVAVDSLVKSDVTLLYANNDLDEYIQLDITVDASMENTELTSKLQAFNDKYSPPVEEVPTGNLQELSADNEKSDGEKNGGEPQANTEEQKKVASFGKADIALNLKITRKQNGQKLSQVKWHLYVGEPAEDKRCKITIIDFKSKVVSLTLGANAYICIGNELPGDGTLPDIPAKIAQFLDGSTNGAVQSDGIGAANNARAQATAAFGGSVVGGVMFGAQVYGNLALDLGIVYGSIDALAGFDISLRKLHGATCVNTNGHPGYKEWYGQGQLYAYLAAALGIRIDLGFYKKDIPLVSAGIGGVLEFGGPNPTYFNGKLRAKVNLLDGLVKFDKKFEFTCGNHCQLFVGNPLDNFILYDMCTLGDTVRANGWSVSQAIPDVVRTAPYINSNAQLNQHFRVLDENELNRIKANYNGDASLLEMEAERTFVFKGYTDSDHNYGTYARLYAYELKDSLTAATMAYNSEKVDLMNPNSVQYKNWCKESYVNIRINGGNPTHHVLDLSTLNKNLKPNYLYRLEIIGRAFEIDHGNEVDPVTFDTDASAYKHKPWVQKQIYYFRTEAETEFADTCDLEQYVAVAFPSYYNKLRDGVRDIETEKYNTVHINDAVAPTIALTRDISNTAYRKGRLIWRITNEKGAQIDNVENAWNVKDNKCNMEPKRKFYGVYNGGNYILLLDYVTYSNDKENNIVTDTLNIGKLHIKVSDSNWRTGVPDEKGIATNLPYEKPFVASRLIRYTDSNTYDGMKNDVMIAWNTYGTGSSSNKLLRFTDPFWYLSYLSNWAFIGGWSFDNKNIKLDVTTSQSAIVNAGVAGVYEGSLAFEQRHQNIADGVPEIKKLFFYDYDQYSKGYGSWPVPEPKSGEHDYLIGYDRRAYPFIPAGKNEKDSLKTYVSAITAEISQRYDDVETFNKLLIDETTQCYSLAPTAGNAAKVAQEYINMHRGQYITVNSEVTKLKTQPEFEDYVNTESFLQLPYYQIVLTTVSGSQYATEMSLYKTFNNGVGWRVLKDKHDRFAKDLTYNVILELLNFNTSLKMTDEYDARLVYMLNNQVLQTPVNSKFNASDAKKLIANAEFYAYRVNSYDYSTGQYSVRGDLLNGYAAKYITIKNPLTTSSTAQSTGSHDYKGNNSDVSVGITTGLVEAEGIGEETDAAKEMAKKVASSLENISTINVIMESYVKKAHEYEKGVNSVISSMTKTFDNMLEDGTDAYLNTTLKQKIEAVSNRDYVEYKDMSGKAADYNQQATVLLEGLESTMSEIAKEAGTSSSSYIKADADYRSCTSLVSQIAEKAAQIKLSDQNMKDLVKQVQDGYKQMQNFMANKDKINSLLNDSHSKAQYVFDNFAKKDDAPEFVSTMEHWNWENIGLKANHDRIYVELHGGKRSVIYHVSVSSFQQTNAQITSQLAQQGIVSNSEAHNTIKNADTDKRASVEYDGAINLMELYNAETNSSYKKDYANEIKKIYSVATDQCNAVYSCLSAFRNSSNNISKNQNELATLIMSTLKKYKEVENEHVTVKDYLIQGTNYYDRSKEMLDTLSTYNRKVSAISEDAAERVTASTSATSSGTFTVVGGTNNTSTQKVEDFLKTGTTSNTSGSQQSNESEPKMEMTQKTEVTPKAESAQQKTETIVQKSTTTDLSQYIPSGLSIAKKTVVLQALSTLSSAEISKFTALSKSVRDALLNRVASGGNIHTLLAAVK